MSGEPRSPQELRFEAPAPRRDLACPSTGRLKAYRAASDDDQPVRRYGGLTLAEWRERLKSIDPQSQASREAVPGLLAIIQDASVPSFTRRQAALTLGRIGPPAREAVPVLIRLLDEEGEREEPTSLWAIKALAYFGPEAKSAAPVLIGRVRDPRRPIEERRAPFEALAKIGAAHSSVVPALMEILGGKTNGPANASTDTSAETAVLRELAAEALAIIGPPASPAVPALIRATRDEQENLRRKSAAALGAMGSASEIAVPALAEALVFDESEAVREAAADALGKVGPAAVPTLRPLLKDPDAEIRRRAAFSLGNMGPAARSAVTSLNEAIQDEDGNVRMNAIEALWKITGDPQPVLSSLVRELQNEDRQLRLRAVKLLTTLGSQAQLAIGPLKELLDDERDYVRSAAAKALEKISVEE